MTSQLLPQARADVEALETDLNANLSDVPVDALDQWAAGVRDLFRSLEVNLDDVNQAKAAFAGAYVTTSMIVSAGRCAEIGLIGTTYLLRHLVDRSAEAKKTDD